MVDSTRKILLKIAAEAEFKELRDLNLELKESINTVARLRSMLKGDVGGAGLRGMAVNAQAAGKGVRGMKQEFVTASTEAENAAQAILAAGNKIKAFRRTAYSESGEAKKGADVYDMGGGIQKVVKTKNEVVSAIEEINKARRSWRDRTPDEVVGTANLENMYRDFGAARRLDTDFNKKRAASAKQSALEQGQQTFAQLRAQKGSVVTPVDVFNAKTGGLERHLELTNKLTGAQFRLNTATGKVTGGFRDMDAAAQRSGDTFGKIIGKVVVWSMATGAVFGTIRAIKGAITDFAGIEKGTIAVARVTENFGQGVSGIGSGAKQLTDDILKLSVEYGQNAKEAMNAAVIYGRLGMSQKEVADAMKYTMATANISGYGMEESAKGIASMVQQFQMGAKDIPGLVDKLSYVDRLSSATMGDLMEAGSRAAGVWHEAGGSVEEFAALVGVVSQRTGRSGAEIGNAFKTMLNRLGTAETQKKLFDMSGISVRDAQGAFKSPMQILKELRNKSESVTTGVARQIEGETAGSRQVNFLINALKGIPEIEKQIEAQTNSTGSAMQQNLMYMEGLASKADQLSAAWTRFTNSVMNSGVSDSMKWWLDWMTQMLSGSEELSPDKGKQQWESGGYTPTLRPLSPQWHSDWLEEMKQGHDVKMQNDFLDFRLKREAERKKLVEKTMNRPYNPATDADMFKSTAQLDAEYNERKREEKRLKAALGRSKQSEVSGLRLGAGGFDLAKGMNEYLPNVQFGGGVLEYGGQMKALEDNLHNIQTNSKIQLRIEDDLAVTPLEAIDGKILKIKKSILEIEKLKTMFPSLKDDGEAAKKIDENLQRMRDTLAGLQEDRPVAGIKQIAESDMKRRVAAREAQEFLAGRIARSPLSGKEEQAGLRESLAILAQNRKSIQDAKRELMTLSVGTAGREMTEDEKVKELNIRKEIHDLELRDADLVGRVDRERVESMLKVKEAAQQTYETTRKAMGQMSDVDMARARITAGRFKRGELGQFGEEAWRMPAELRQQFTNMENLFPGMRIMPELNSAPEDWFTRAERKGPNGEKAYQPFAPVYEEATKGLTLSMNIGDAENKIDALGNSLIAYLSTNIGQLWDELIARTDAAAKPPAVKRTQGVVR